MRSELSCWLVVDAMHGGAAFVVNVLSNPFPQL